MKKFLVLLLALAMCLSAFGCNRHQNDSAKDDVDLLKDIDLTADEEYEGVLNIRTYSHDTEIEIMNSLINAFKQKYPYIRINYTTELLDNYYQSLTNDFGVAQYTNDYENVPDVFWISQDNIDSFYDLDNIMFPLSKIDEADDSFSQTIFAEDSLKTCSVNGTMYILPRDFNEVVMFFNQDIFDAANVNYPTAQMSQEDFMQMLADLREGLNNSSASNEYGVLYKDACTYLIDMNAMWDSWVWPLVRSFGGEVVNENKEAVLNSENTFNAVKFWKEMRTKNYVGPLASSNVGVSFKMQQAPIFIHTRSMMTGCFPKEGDNRIRGVKHLGVTALPQLGTKYSIASGASGYSMYYNSVHKTEAWLFLKFIASEEGQNALCASGNGIPSVKSMLTDPDAAWRKYTSEYLGSAFDNNAFIYGMDFDVLPYTTTRDFYQYVPISQQKNILECLRACFVPIDSESNGDDVLRENISNQNELIAYYLRRK